MPLTFIHCPKDYFSSSHKNAMVEELTTIALKNEGLSESDFVRSTAWTFIKEYDTENIFKGGLPQNANGISVQIHFFDGGLDTGRKEKLLRSLHQSFNVTSTVRFLFIF